MAPARKGTPWKTWTGTLCEMLHPCSGITGPLGRFSTCTSASATGANTLVGFCIGMEVEGMQMSGMAEAGLGSWGQGHASL